MMTVRATLTGILLIRVIPVALIALFSSRGFIDTGHADPLLYLSGAQAILKTGTNPFNFFPPLNFLFIAALLYIGNGSPLLPLAGIAVTGWLTVVGLYFLTKELFGDEKTALAAAVISGISPDFIFYGINFYSETLAIFFIVMSFYMIARYYTAPQPSYVLFSGILWGLASLTRGGLHFFAPVIGVIMLIHKYKPGWRARVQSAVLFLLATYVTIVIAGGMCRPVQGESALNSKSGVGSMVHGANRITTSCSDYGDIRGNIFYDINNCREHWPAGSQLYSEELMKSDTVTILSGFIAFAMHDPVTYLKNSCIKLSCFFAPNQLVLYFLKTNFTGRGILSGGLCLIISLFYMLVICGGLWGMALARDSFRPVFISFIVFYCALIFFTVGNSKLRLPLMPFFSIYCAYFLIHVKASTWRKAMLHKWNLVLVLLFLSNSIYKYPELLLSPAEIHVQKIELCNQLGFPKTALFLLQQKGYGYTESQKLRMHQAELAARGRITGTVDVP